MLPPLKAPAHGAETIVFVNEIPHTATGKIQKLALREPFGTYEFPAD